MPRKAAVLLLRPIVQTISTAAVTIVPSTNLSLGAILADRGVVCQPALAMIHPGFFFFSEWSTVSLVRAAASSHINIL